MSGKANFRVDPRLATLLGENYRSTEHAIRELVDNSWDADAEHVSIALPEPFTNQPIVVADDGAGMTEAELRREYLLIAHDRRSRGGGRTLLKGRPIRGRKGIGKFAGLVAAEHMKVETRAKGNLSILELGKSSLLASKQDLESIDLPFAATQCHPDEHGTTIVLSELNSRFSLPSADTLRELLALEFGRHPGFSITVNGEALTHEDIQGEPFAEEVELPNVGSVSIRFTIMDNPRGAKHAGVVTRVGGKVVGKPSWFGLDQDDELPRKILNRVVGEIEADGLEGDVTADWGALFDNSKAYQTVREWARDLLKKRIAEVCHREVNLAKARKQKQLNELLSKLPEHRRPMAERALDKIFRRFYGDAEERIDVLISLTLEAFEKDEYWSVCQKIENADHSDVATLADALQEFGLADLAYMGGQARRRLQFLDELDKLARDGSTLESTMHKALETNLWVFGPEYSLMASNKTLARTIEDFTGAKYSGPNAAKRPDLLMAEDVLDRHLLVEFKRPSHSIGRDDENQAEKYRDELTPRFGTMDILVIGGVKERSIQTQYQKPDIKILTYEAVISRARTQLRWLLEQLSSG